MRESYKNWVASHPWTLTYICVISTLNLIIVVLWK